VKSHKIVIILISIKAFENTIPKIIKSNFNQDLPFFDHLNILHVYVYIYF